MFPEKWRKADSASVLLLFRDGAASDWASLCHVLDVDPNSSDTPNSVLRGIVWKLIEANLLVIDKPAPSMWELDGGIIASDNVPKLLRALNLSLKEMAAIDPSRSMFIEPSFGRPDSIPPDKQLDLFILMPFSSNIKGVYEDHIKSVAASLNLKVARADDFFTAHAIVSDIWTAICKSRVILADCTGRNPNVFYEIGLAHAVGKPVVLIAQNSEDVPFDIAHYRLIRYEYTPRGMKNFESTLTNTLQEVFHELEEPW
jgi:hypothetical protein